MKHKQLLYFLLFSNAAALYVLGQSLYNRGFFREDLNADQKMRLVFMIPFVLSFAYLSAKLFKDTGSTTPKILDKEDSFSTNDDWE